MEQIWDSYITREDLEIAPGRINENLVRTLTLNTYLVYIRDFIELGGNELPDISRDQTEEFMTEVFMCLTHALEGRYPEPEEIRVWLEMPENREAHEFLTRLCVQANSDNWPEIEQRLRETLGPPAEETTEQLKRLGERERRLTEEESPEWRRKLEQDGFIEL